VHLSSFQKTFAAFPIVSTYLPVSLVIIGKLL
jgi:hypothetical protein